MATITQIERYNQNLAKSQATIALTDMVLLQNSSISYKDLLDALEAVFTPSGGTVGDGNEIICGRRIGTDGGHIICGRRV